MSENEKNEEITETEESIETEETAEEREIKKTGKKCKWFIIIAVAAFVAAAAAVLICVVFGNKKPDTQEILNRYVNAKIEIDFRTAFTMMYPEESLTEVAKQFGYDDVEKFLTNKDNEGKNYRQLMPYKVLLKDFKVETESRTESDAVGEFEKMFNEEYKCNLKIKDMYTTAVTYKTNEDGKTWQDQAEVYALFLVGDTWYVSPIQ